MSRPLRIEYPDAWYHGSIVDRVKKQILKDKQFRNKVAGIKKILNKS